MAGGKKQNRETELVKSFTKRKGGKSLPPLPELIETLNIWYAGFNTC